MAIFQCLHDFYQHVSLEYPWGDHKPKVAIFRSFLEFWYIFNPQPIKNRQMIMQAILSCKISLDPTSRDSSIPSKCRTTDLY